MAGSDFGSQQALVPYKLLLSLSEQMKLPLLQISRQAEIGALGLDASFAQIRSLADNAMTLIDSYNLSLQLHQQQDIELASESVSVASVLYEADLQLKEMAQMYNVQLELNIGGKYGPVLAHRKGLQSGILGIASALIQALPSHVAGTPTALTLAAHRCRYGIVAGVYADIPTLSADALQRGRRLYGSSRQPMVDISHTNGAGIFIADAIFRSMRLKLQVTRHKKHYGLGVVLQPSAQLSLV